MKEKGIILDPDTKVLQKGIILNGIGRDNERVTLYGSEDVECSLRAVLYLNTKRLKGENPFTEEDWDRFMKERVVFIKPKKDFFVNVLIDEDTGVGYGVTFKKLTPLTQDMFMAYLKGERVNVPKVSKFRLGVMEFVTSAGVLLVDFGMMNGNSGIEITNQKGVKILAKHLGKSIEEMCKNLNQMLKSSEIRG